MRKSDGRRTDASWSSVGPPIQLPVTGVLLKVYKRMPSMSGNTTPANFAHAMNTSRRTKKRMRETTRRGRKDQRSGSITLIMEVIHSRSLILSSTQKKSWTGKNNAPVNKAETTNNTGTIFFLFMFLYYHIIFNFLHNLYQLLCIFG